MKKNARPKSRNTKAEVQSKRKASAKKHFALSKYLPKNKRTVGKIIFASLLLVLIGGAIPFPYTYAKDDEISFTTENQKLADLELGESKTIQEGRNGKKTVNIEAYQSLWGRLLGLAPMNQKESSSTVTSEATAKIIGDGTRKYQYMFCSNGSYRYYPDDEFKDEKEKVEYDAAGNLTYKTGIGTTFKYIDGTNRLQSVSGGNYNPPAWDIIEYTSFNKISKVVQAQGNYSLILTYGADQKRKKSVTTKNGKSDARYYAGAIYEEDHLSTGEVKQRHYIFANGGMIAIHEQSSTSGETLNYVHKDHLGSVQAYSDKNGKLVQELSYDAWGRRRSADEWKYYLNLPDANAWHERGFTGHEHLDLFEMINMDGRMYDPMLGRFLTPDPFVQAPDYTQGLNRYIYCLNNPLSLVDPSGYSWLSKNWKSLAAAGIGIGVSIIATPAVGFLLSGALGGMASGISGALLNGANVMVIAQSAIQGAVWGGIGAGVSNISGTIGTNVIKNMLAHSISQGFLEGIKGGNIKHGFMIGLISSAGASGISAFGKNWSVVGKTAANAIIGGTAAELGGGKFANGAITGAYAMLFNHLAANHQKKTTWDKVSQMIEGLYPVAIGVTASVDGQIIGSMELGVGDILILQGPDQDSFMEIAETTLGLGWCGASANINLIFFFYNGDVSNFRMSSLLGESYVLNLSFDAIGSGNAGISVAEDQYGAKIIGISFGGGAGISPTGINGYIGTSNTFRMFQTPSKSGLQKTNKQLHFRQLRK